MSQRTPAFNAPISGAEVRKTAPALYWLTYEPERPRGCAVCPFAMPTLLDAHNPLAGKAVCKIAERPYLIEDMLSPACNDANWQYRAREEIGQLWERLMPSDAELAEIAAEEGAPNPMEVVRGSQGVPLPSAIIRQRGRKKKPSKGEG